MNRTRLNLPESIYSTSSTKFVGVFLPTGKTKMAALASDSPIPFSISSLHPLNGAKLNSIKLNRKQVLYVLYRLCFWGRSDNQDGRPTSNRLRHFHLFSSTAVGNSTKLDRNQDLNVLSQVCVCVCLFSAPEPNAQVHYCDHALSVVHRPSVCPSIVRPSLTFHIFDFFSETAWQEARSQRPLPSLCFFGPIEKQDGRPGL